MLVRGMLCLWIAWAGCGDSNDLSSLPNKRLLVNLDFAPGGQYAVPYVFAGLTFDRPADAACPPTLPIAVDLDGVPFGQLRLNSQNGPSTCFFVAVLSAPAPPPSPMSTVRFSDSSGTAMLVANLLEPRTLVSSVSNGTAIHPGDNISFSWSMTSDQFGSIAASFSNGSTQLDVSGALIWPSFLVAVPQLTPGNWILTAEGTASPRSTCVNALGCSVVISTHISLTVTVP